MLYLTANAEPYIPTNHIPLRKAVLFLIMASVITAVEYIVGMVCLKITKVRLWDYSNHIGNIQGVICPLYSFYWWALGALYYFLLHFCLASVLDTLAESFAVYFILGFAYGIFIIDVAYSSQIMKKIRRFAAESSIVIKLDELREDIYSTIRQYGKPHFLMSIPSGAQLKEMLEKYYDRHISPERLKNRLHLQQKKGDWQ